LSPFGTDWQCRCRPSALTKGGGMTSQRLEHKTGVRSWSTLGPDRLLCSFGLSATAGSVACARFSIVWARQPHARVGVVHGQGARPTRRSRPCHTASSDGRGRRAQPTVWQKAGFIFPFASCHAASQRCWNLGSACGGDDTVPWYAAGLRWDDPRPDRVTEGWHTCPIHSVPRMRC